MKRVAWIQMGWLLLVLLLPSGSGAAIEYSDCDRGKVANVFTAQSGIVWVAFAKQEGTTTIRTAIYWDMSRPAAGMLLNQIRSAQMRSVNVTVRYPGLDSCQSLLARNDFFGIWVGQ